MKYILDFDHTLLDTTAFVAATKQDGYALPDIITPDIWNTYNVHDFLYPEVMTWLKSKPKADLHILTAITPELGPLSADFQKEKLHSGNFADLVDGITFMTGDKGEYVQEIADGAEAVFVDDKLDHHLSVKVHAPHVQCVLMQRPGEAVVDTTHLLGIDTVHNLHELDTLLPQFN